MAQISVGEGFDEGHKASESWGRNVCEVANTLLHLLLSPQLWRVLAAHPISKHRLQCRRQQRTKHGGDIKNSICFLGHLSQCRCRLPKYIPAQHWLGKTGSYFGSAASSRSRSHRAGAVQCTGTTSFINGTGHRMQVPHAPQATLGFSHCCSAH